MVETETTDTASVKGVPNGAAPPATPKKAPNVKLAAKQTPLGAGAVTVGMETVATVPDEATQKAGFYCESPEWLMEAYPGKFKLMEAKGSDE